MAFCQAYHLHPGACALRTRIPNIPKGTSLHDGVTDGGKGFGVHDNRQVSSAAVALGDWKVGRAVVHV